MVIIFDVVGTIFSLNRVRQNFEENKLSGELVDLWFARLLQTSVAATLTGQFIPFREAAEANLKQVLAAADKPEQLAGRLLEALQELQPWPDAEDCLRKLRAQDHLLCALTNSGAEATNALLRKAGLQDVFQMVVSVEEVRKWKPHPAPYQLALERCGSQPARSCLVAAHGWDVLGAAAVGMQTVWVSRLEKRWPFPGDPPGRVAASLAQVPEAIMGITL
jgi:2-haloacid dehalogenase